MVLDEPFRQLLADPHRVWERFVDDKHLYQQILGLASPWFVDRVQLDLAGQQVDVFVEHEDAAWVCPHCGKACPLHDHGPVRRWRHLDTCQMRTFLHEREKRAYSC